MIPVYCEVLEETDTVYVGLLSGGFDGFLYYYRPIKRAIIYNNNSDIVRTYEVEFDDIEKCVNTCFELDYERLAQSVIIEAEDIKEKKRFIF